MTHANSVLKSTSRSKAPAQIAYVRPFWADEQTPPGAKTGDLYALHAADGQRLAVFADRDTAFAAARRNNFAPENAH